MGFRNLLFPVHKYECVIGLVASANLIDFNSIVRDFAGEEAAYI
jgi:hypothetical protein